MMARVLGAVAALAASACAAPRHRREPDPGAEPCAGRRDDFGALRAYVAAVYPAANLARKSNATVRKLFESLDYLYAPTAARAARYGAAVAGGGAAAAAAAPLPYVPSGWWFDADRVPRRARWLGGASATRWARPAVYVDTPRRSANAPFSSVGARFGPAPSWTNPLAVARVVFAPARPPRGAKTL